MTSALATGVSSFKFKSNITDYVYYLKYSLAMLLRSKSDPPLTEPQRQMYAAEKLENFRWISKLLATYSDHILSSIDLAPDELYKELAELGESACGLPSHSRLIHRQVNLQKLPIVPSLLLF